MTTSARTPTRRRQRPWRAYATRLAKTIPMSAIGTRLRPAGLTPMPSTDGSRGTEAVAGTSRSMTPTMPRAAIAAKAMTIQVRSDLTAQAGQARASGTVRPSAHGHPPREPAAWWRPATWASRPRRASALRPSLASARHRAVPGRRSSIRTQAWARPSPKQAPELNEFELYGEAGRALLEEVFDWRAIQRRFSALYGALTGR